MARPQLDEQERRARTVGVRIRAAEEAELRLGAAELRELNRIGVNLNQMARALNSRAVSSPGRDPGGGRACGPPPCFLGEEDQLD